ncbi:MAG: hypothetical protein E7Z87_03765 [Cyanobacteria bacterium SIG26]|nr:hypothetical protein [Cyanobacteria bacterium SIG26]
MNINPLHDAETMRQHRNLTNSQRKNNMNTKEGVLVNNFVKEKECNFNDTKNSYLISDKISMPKQLYEDRKIVDKKLIPISTIAIAVMASVASLTAFVNHSAKVATNLAKEKWLPAVTRNVQLSNELHQIVYQIVQNPNRKTFIAGAGVLALSAMAFMGKTFFDGYKDIWVKRKEANIQKNLQENLISVETQSFSGKMQIIRSMLSKYATDFEKYISPDNEKILPNFGRKKYANIPFLSKNTPQKPQEKSGIGNIILGIGTFAGIVGLGFLSLKNLSKSKLHLQKYLEDAKEGITRLVSSSTESTKDIDKVNLEQMLVAAEASDDFVKTQINALKWGTTEEKQALIEKIITKIKTSTTKVNPNIGGDGTPKPAFNSFVEDYRAFFYNWLLDTDNPQFKQLFLGVTGITAVSYGGKLTGDAIKEVQVKKINADTELELQKRLVSTELRNFKSKKDSAIKPLVQEFYKHVDSGKCTKEELKTMAENILFEIKNGPPFVYS